MKRILIVDDEAIARRLMTKTLSNAGYDVEQAGNGKEAWELLQESQPDALITDIDMPIMTGEQLCRRIAKDLSDRSFPIIVVTSKTALEHRAWARQVDNLSFIEKPLSMRKLIDRLGQLLNDEAVSQEEEES